MPTSRKFPFMLGLAIALILAVPLAAAASLPVWGEVGGVDSFSLWFLILAILALAAGLGAKAAIKRFPVAGKWISRGGLPLGVAIILGAAFINTGGAFTGFQAPSASAAAAVDDVVEFDALTYEATSDVTFYAADSETKSSVNPVISIFSASDAATDKAMVEGTATAEYSATLSSGTATINGIQVQSLGCEVDIHLTVSGYYEQIARSVFICVKKNALGNNDLAVPTFYLDDLATLSLTTSDATHTCANGSTCTYSIILRNTEADSLGHGIAVKWATGGGATLNSVDNGDCEIQEVSSVQYIVFTGEASTIEELAAVTCPISVTYSLASATFNLTADDLWQKYGASGWNTNSNVNGATATAARQVSRA